MFLIFEHFINMLIIGQHTARYYLIVFIPLMFLLSQRFNFNVFYKLFLCFLCLPQMFSIVFLLFNYYTLPQEKFLSNFVNEYNQIKWIEENIDEQYITDLRINYYSNNKVNISLTKWSEKYSKEISKVIKIIFNMLLYQITKNMRLYSQIIFFYAVIILKK